MSYPTTNHYLEYPSEAGIRAAAPGRESDADPNAVPVGRPGVSQGNDARWMFATWPGGVAALNHRLPDVTPPASSGMRLIGQRSTLLQRLTVRQRPGVMTFRYWQEGPGYDRNLKQDRSDVAAIHYVHMNPVRRGLCERGTDWKWSSARYFLDPDSPIDPDLPRITPLPPEVFD